MKQIFIYIIILCMALFGAAGLYAQMEGLHGSFDETRNGLHAGNQFRTTFYNDGTFGVNDRPPDIGGEWPINSGHIYLLDGNVFVGSEVIDEGGNVKRIFSEVRGGGDPGDPSVISVGDSSPEGDWWTFLPLPGFASADTNKIAMSKWPWAWPAYWPDRADDARDPGWRNDAEDEDPERGAWNGYFGKNIFNADEESYFVADDYHNREFNFYPDENNRDRRGLGLRMSVRGFQWSNALVEDAIFCLFDLENIGTYSHDKMVFAYKIGNNMGDTETGWDSNDDNGAYERDENIAYLYDYDDIGAGGFTPVGYFGGAFLESPGNQFDGIDNDGDGAGNGGNVITEELFAPRTLTAGEEIVVIDYKTFERELISMPNDTLRIPYQDLIFKFWPGKTLEEIPYNLVDDNLNGVIDESNGATVGTAPNEVTNYLFLGYKYVDYFTGDGSDNLLLDERRDDGIDNDGDWDPLFDDLGLDGLAETGDTGEGDGVPTSGAGTDLPGEPHIDKTDIDETDMLGLTSFTLYQWTDMPHHADETVWKNVLPGYFNDIMQNDNIELLYGSGYFPMPPESIERFSMALVCGVDHGDLIKNKNYVAKAYNENYNFSKAPTIPTVKVVAGDNRVTLFWNDIAEKTYDPITGYDFEGYRIYRSTDPGWNDSQVITDGFGVSQWQKPLAQFDVDNEFEGFAAIPISGVYFYLGTNTGLVHSFVDTTAKNGFTYYYAVTAYDHGDTEAVPPSECTKFISISTSGEIEDKGDNVVVARPEAPAAGFIAADSSGAGWLTGSRTDGTVALDVQNPDEIKDGHVYQVVFEDTVVSVSARNHIYTKNFSLLDVTDAASPITLIDRSTNFMNEEDNPSTDGFMVALENVAELNVDLENSVKSRDHILDFRFRPYKKGSSIVGTALSANYRLEFGEKGYGSAIEYDRFDAIDSSNVKVYNTSTGEEIAYTIEERDGSDGLFSGFSEGRANRSDILIFLEKDANDSLVVSWGFEFLSGDSTQTGVMEPGDFIDIAVTKPFTSNDIYQFTMEGEKVDMALAKDQMDDIKVVPNPYVVTNSWEPLNPYANGRGPRELHFIHLPPQCTIRIFTVRGQLVQTLEHDEPAWNGTEIWDMLTKDQLDISYGVYVYHVEADGIGQKIGKFAIVK